MYVCMYVWGYRYKISRSKEGVEFHGTGVIGSCKSSDMGEGRPDSGVNEMQHHFWELYNIRAGQINK